MIPCWRRCRHGWIILVVAGLDISPVQLQGALESTTTQSPTIQGGVSGSSALLDGRIAGVVVEGTIILKHPPKTLEDMLLGDKTPVTVPYTGTATPPLADDGSSFPVLPDTHGELNLSVRDIVAPLEIDTLEALGPADRGIRLQKQKPSSGLKGETLQINGFPGKFCVSFSPRLFAQVDPEDRKMFQIAGVCCRLPICRARPVNREQARRRRN